MQADHRRLNTIHQSLLRPILVMGAERRLALALWVTFFALLLPWKGWFAAGCAVVLAAVGQPCLIYLAKLDPQFSEVYIRHFHYQQKLYPARTSIWCRPPSKVPYIVACWLAAELVGLIMFIKFSHPKIVFTLCTVGAAFGHWQLSRTSDIHPTIP
jgi:type IV secretion system protein TrbD